MPFRNLSLARMSRLAVLLALAAAVSVVQGQAAAPAAPAAAVSCPPTATLDQLIAALDAAISGPANKDRACFRQVLLPNVRLIPVNPTTGVMRVLSVDDWITAVAKNGDEPVTEHQIKHQSETFGHVAHLWSTYETTLAGKPVARGINSIQAEFDGQNWHIVEVLWQAESPDNKIPAQYLP
jgi:hypothetical protein